MDKAFQPPISKGRAVQIAFSVTLRFAESIFKGDTATLSVVETIRNVLGVTALCLLPPETVLIILAVAPESEISTSRVDGVGVDAIGVAYVTTISR